MSPLLILSRRASQLSAAARRNRAIVQVLFGTLAFCLGYWGWHIQKTPQGWEGYVNNFFRTLQLITFNFPREFETGVPLQLQIARLLVPLAAALATFDILVGAVTRPLRLALLPRTKNHLIVVGDTKLTDDAFRTLARHDRQIVAVAPKVDAAHRDMLESFGLTVIETNPAEPVTLDGLSVRNAAALLLAGGDDLENLDLAMMALAAVQGRSEGMPALILAVLIDREDLAGELDSVLDGIARNRRVRYRRLCPDRDGLRLDLARFAPVFTKPDRDTPSHVLMVGLKGRWEQVVMQLLIAAQDHPTERPILSFAVTADDAGRLAAWRASRPELDLVARFEILACAKVVPNEADVAAWRERRGAPHLVVVLVDEDETVPTALALRRKGNVFGTEMAPMLVRRTRKDRMLAELATCGLSDRDFSHMAAFGGLVRAQTIECLLDRKGDALALAIHANYLMKQRGEMLGDSVALADWDDLPENLREANRAAAAHAPILFRATGFSVQAGVGTDERTPLELGEFDLDRLSRIEHRRWMANRIDRGWRFDPVRDDARCLHPDLRPYDELDSADREKDRDTVLTLVQALYAAGRVLVPENKHPPESGLM